MNIEDFSKRMMDLMPQCIRGFARHESNYLSRGEITLPQFWVLEYISNRDSVLMSELADYLSISRPSATGLIDRLISQGFVRRETPDDDRRTVTVSITSKGRKIVDNVLEQKRNMFVNVFSQISPKEREQYIHILEQVAQILSRPPQEPK